MKHALLFLLLTSFALAQTPPLSAIKRAELLVTETIPHLKLKDATFEQALEAVRLAWNERHPDDPLPVGFTSYQSDQSGHEKNDSRITLELKNAPYEVALLYIANLSFKRFSIRQGLPVIQDIGGCELDWSTHGYEVTPEILSGLKLGTDSKPEDLRRAFADMGVKLEDWMKPFLHAKGTQLVVTCGARQHELISGILSLLRNGFKISK